MKQKAVLVLQVLLGLVLSYFVFFNSRSMHPHPECPENIWYTSDMRIKCTLDYGFPLSGALNYYGNAWERSSPWIGNITYLAIDILFALIVSYTLVFFASILLKRIINIFSAKFPTATYFLRPNTDKLICLILLFGSLSYLFKGEVSTYFADIPVHYLYWGLPLPIISSSWSLPDIISGIGSSLISLAFDIIFWYLIACFIVAKFNTIKQKP